MRRFNGRADTGRISIGTIVTLLVVIGVAYGAYWALGEYGFLGSDEPASDATPQVAVSAPDERPQWLHDTSYELPPLMRPDEDSLAPASRVVEDWVWGQVDETWSVTVVREGEGDNYTWLSDFQALYLVSPTDDYFKVTDLETVFDENLLHWDPELLVAWTERAGKSDMAQAVEYDLRTGEATTGFAGSVFSSTNVVRHGVANLEFHSDLPDGRELWITHSPDGYVTGVVWRDGQSWDGSLVVDQIRRMAKQGHGTDGGVDGWFDAATGRAVYHGVYLDPDTHSLAEQTWVRHDLATDGLDTDAVVPTPRDDCKPVDGPRSGTFEGDRIVADCGGVEYLLDPYDMGAPTER